VIARVLIAFATLAFAALAAAQATIAPFSGATAGGPLPEGWREQHLPNKRAAEVSLVEDDGKVVIRVRSDAAFGTAATTFDMEAPILSWRWKVDRVLDGAKLGTKDSDDFAARVYVSFEIPPEDLTTTERTKLKIARMVYGDVPSAAICYVWDNNAPKGTSIWSKHGERVRIIVLQSGSAEAGHWMEERRDMAADFRAAFGREPPRMTGIAAGNDTDQTKESVTAWFGDFRIEPR